jgi:hypothetical protein
MLMGAPKIWSQEISVVQNEQTLQQQVLGCADVIRDPSHDLLA